MNGDKIQQPENILLPLKKRKVSLPDFAAGKSQEGPLKRTKTTFEVKDREKTQKKVRFKEELEEGHPISKYANHQDRKILNERDQNHLLKDCLEDFIELSQDIPKINKQIKNILIKINNEHLKELEILENIKSRLDETEIRFNQIIKDSEAILKNAVETYNKKELKEDTSDALYCQIDKLTKILAFLDSLNVSIQYHAKQNRRS
jgi:hypothetical protein